MALSWRAATIPSVLWLGALAEGWHLKHTWGESEQPHELGKKMPYKAEGPLTLSTPGNGAVIEK